MKHPVHLLLVQTGPQGDPKLTPLTELSIEGKACPKHVFVVDWADLAYTVGWRLL